MSNNRTRTQGVTLIELIVAMSIFSILIGLTVPLFDLYLSNIASLARATQSSDLQAAARSMESSLSLAHKFSTKAPVAPPFGANNAGVEWKFTTALTAPSSGNEIRTLIATSYAVDTTSRTDAARRLATCNGNKIESIMVFFIKDSTLYRRTIAGTCTPPPAPSLTSTCAAANVGTPPCTANDAVLLHNVANLSVDYFNEADDTIPISNIYSINEATAEVAVNNAKAIAVTIKTTTLINGKNNTATKIFRISKFNES